MTAPAQDRLVLVEVSGDAYLTRLEQVFRRLGESVLVVDTLSGVVRCPRCSRRNRVPPVGTGVPVCGFCRRALPWIAAAGDDDFAAVAEQASLPVLVGVWAPWCGLSWLVRPVLQRLALGRPGEVKLVEVDIIGAPQQAQRFEMRAAPTLLVLHHGEVLAHRYGVAPAPELRDWLDATLPGTDVDRRT